MPSISELTALNTVVATAQVPVYNPTGTTAADKDRAMTMTKLANVPSVIKNLADSAEITVGAEATNVRDITVQLSDADGTALTSMAVVHLVVFADAAGAALSSGGSTGIALDADGLILATIVSKKVFLAMTDDTGLLTLTWTDTGTDAAYLGVVLPDGRVVIGAAMTNT